MLLKYRIKFNSSDIPEKTVRAIIKSGSKYYLLAKEKSAGGNPYINTTSRRSYVEMIFNSSLTPAAPLDEAILIEQQSGSSKVVYHNIK